jgi:flavin-dependent dehydrogenase
METCEVLIVGGGPAGSACAWKLKQGGLDVMILDAAHFPRDKVCAGWITPQVVSALSFDLDEYRPGRTLQPITGFRTGIVGSHGEVETRYAHPVGFGIRRCEFDHYLLDRSGARLKLGARLGSIRRAGDRWIVNDEIQAAMLVGAGGHFCPVARWLNGPFTATSGPLVVAQEAEFPVDSAASATLTSIAGWPELYFSRDLKGYGWCFRKQGYLNVGLGRLDRHALPEAVSEFAAFLEAKARIPSRIQPAWRGHSYALYHQAHRRSCVDGVLLVGDAAGLAYPESGEGIRPGIESGLLAAQTIVEAGGRYTTELLEPYERRLGDRLASPSFLNALFPVVPAGIRAPLGRALLRVPNFVRRVVLDQWFLHSGEEPLVFA